MTKTEIVDELRQVVKMMYARAKEWGGLSDSMHEQSASMHGVLDHLSGVYDDSTIDEYLKYLKRRFGALAYEYMGRQAAYLDAGDTLQALVDTIDVLDKQEDG